MAKIVTVDADGAIPIECFKAWVDITLVSYYKVWVRKDMSLRIRFYDKKKRWLRNSKV